ncbi:MAG TPA: alpha-L-fucosidase [Caulobacteraceae bacterium]|nr:alpha-L-fucosidase [Caulobacteraceae bacterium]
MAQIEPTLESLAARSLPTWYDEAKFGIFIHWGLFAVPGFAPRLGSIGDAFRLDYDRAVTMTPYTEWYWNAIRTPGTPSARFHRQHFGDADYAAFRAPFLDGLKRWDPAAWAEAFRDAGARYVVLVTKHHDGFCLWPSGVANPHQADWTSGRDITGELAAAVRAAGLKFGVYYSGGIDWTFNRQPLLTLGDFIASTPGGGYVAYAEAQVRELIARYEPSVLWNDIAWPTGPARLCRLFADYYNAVPDGVVNDRWAAASPARSLLKIKSVRRSLDRKLKASFARQSGEARGIIPAPVPHSDFRTPEYAAFQTIQAKKWEATRGMSHSFGFNRDDTEADYEPVETLLAGLIDGAARNGNLLLNVGPRATDAGIPKEQLSRLKQFGAWLRRNGQAIHGARPWSRSDGVTADGVPVRFTVSGGALNLVFVGVIAGDRTVVRDLELRGPARLLGDASPVTLSQIGPDLALTFRAPPGDAFAPVVRVDGVHRALDR